MSEGKCKAVSCQLGTFDDVAVATLVKLHGLQDIAENVKGEKAWLENTVCHQRKTAFFRIFLNTDGRVVLNGNILTSDLSVLTGNNWLNLSIIQGFLDIINEQSTDTKAFILNSLIGLKGNLFEDQLKKYAKGTVRFFTFIICVGGNIAETFLGSSYHQGCYWSLLWALSKANGSVMTA